MNWRDEPRGPSATELHEHTLSPAVRLTPEDRERIRAARDVAAREREDVVWRDGKWRLPPAGGTHR